MSVVANPTKQIGSMFWTQKILFLHEYYRSLDCWRFKKRMFCSWARDWPKRPCLNELQKEYCVKIKLIVLDWQWVTLISWCQMNCDGHSSPVMHNVEGKKHKLLAKLKIMSEKYTKFWNILMKYFQITWVDIRISLNKNDNTPILHTCMTLFLSCFCFIAGYLVDPLWF